MPRSLHRNPHLSPSSLSFYFQNPTPQTGDFLTLYIEVSVIRRIIKYMVNANSVKFPRKVTFL